MSQLTNSQFYQAGTICWTEIPVISQSRAQKFYEEVFGWKMSTMPGMDNCPETGEKLDQPHYSFFSKGSMNGAFSTVKPENLLTPSTAAPAPTAGEKDARASYMGVRVTFNVDSVDTALKSIEKAGGSVWR
jgi:predicted enzyme related to lactoylglutathione lyase